MGEISSSQYINDAESVNDGDRFIGDVQNNGPTRSRKRSAMLQNIGIQIQLIQNVGGVLWGDPTQAPNFQFSGFLPHLTPGAGQFGWAMTLPASTGGGNSGTTATGGFMASFSPNADTGDSYQYGLWISFSNGYGGSAETSAILGINYSAMPTGAGNAWPGSSDAVGVTGNAQGAGSTNGINVGIFGVAFAAKKNFAVFGKVQSGVSGGMSVAVGGYNQDSVSDAYGGVFVLGNSNSRFTGSAALIADNGGSTTSWVAKFQVASVVKAGVDPKGNVVLSNAALGTTATDGFTYLPSCAGAPTGTPTAYTGIVPCVIDTTNGKLWSYYGGAWHFIAFT